MPCCVVRGGRGPAPPTASWEKISSPSPLPAQMLSIFTARRGHCSQGALRLPGGTAASECRGALQLAASAWGHRCHLLTFARRCPAPAPAAPQGDCEQRRHSSLELFRRQHPLRRLSLRRKKKHPLPITTGLAGALFVFSRVSETFKKTYCFGGLSHAMGPIPSMPFHGHPLAAPCPSYCYPQAVLFSMPSQDYPTTITWASPGHVLAKPSQGRLAGAARQVRLPRPGSLS